MLGGVKKGAGVRSEADDSVWAKGQMIQAMPAGVGVRSHAVHLRGFRPFLTLGPFLWYNGLTDTITHVVRDHRMVPTRALLSINIEENLKGTGSPTTKQYSLCFFFKISMNSMKLHLRNIPYFLYLYPIIYLLDWSGSWVNSLTQFSSSRNGLEIQKQTNHKNVKIIF